MWFCVVVFYCLFSLNELKPGQPGGESAFLKDECFFIVFYVFFVVVPVWVYMKGFEMNVKYIYFLN